MFCVCESYDRSVLTFNLHYVKVYYIRQEDEKNNNKLNKSHKFPKTKIKMGFGEVI